MTPFIIPVFITHQGCPHRCIFCDQASISGQGGKAPGPGEVAAEVARRLAEAPVYPGREIQVAFYGGSFTGLPRSRQAALLDAVAPFLAGGRVHSIRLSTRPDYVDRGTAAFLRARGVTVVELGVQSLDPQVLAASRRGYSPDRVAEAFALLREAGLLVGGQLMVGLPGETTRGLLASARRLADLGPALVRLYPALVLRGTGLAALYRAGVYRPLSLAAAVARTARLKRLFDAEGIPVARLGLSPSAALEAALAAGPYHPAFGELVLSRLLFREMRRTMAGLPADGHHTLALAGRDRSLFLGPANGVRQRLAALGRLDRFDIVFDDLQPRGTVKVKV